MLNRTVAMLFIWQAFVGFGDCGSSFVKLLLVLAADQTLITTMILNLNAGSHRWLRVWWFLLCSSFQSIEKLQIHTYQTDCHMSPCCWLGGFIWSPDSCSSLRSHTCDHEQSQNFLITPRKSHLCCACQSVFLIVKLAHCCPVTDRRNRNAHSSCSCVECFQPSGLRRQQWASFVKKVTLSCFPELFCGTVLNEAKERLFPVLM